MRGQLPPGGRAASPHLPAATPGVVRAAEPSTASRSGPAAPLAPALLAAPRAGPLSLPHPTGSDTLHGVCQPRLSLRQRSEGTDVVWGAPPRCSRGTPLWGPHSLSPTFRAQLHPRGPGGPYPPPRPGSGGRPGVWAGAGRPRAPSCCSWQPRHRPAALPAQRCGRVVSVSMERKQPGRLRSWGAEAPGSPAALRVGGAGRWSPLPGWGAGESAPSRAGAARPGSPRSRACVCPGHQPGGPAQGHPSAATGGPGAPVLRGAARSRSGAGWPWS